MEYKIQFKSGKHYLMVLLNGEWVYYGEIPVDVMNTFMEGVAEGLARNEN